MWQGASTQAVRQVLLVSLDIRVCSCVCLLFTPTSPLHGCVFIVCTYPPHTAPPAAPHLLNTPPRPSLSSSQGLPLRRGDTSPQQLVGAQPLTDSRALALSTWAAGGAAARGSMSALRGACRGVLASWAGPGSGMEKGGGCVCLEPFFARRYGLSKSTF